MEKEVETWKATILLFFVPIWTNGKFLFHFFPESERNLQSGLRIQTVQETVQIRKLFQIHQLHLIN